MRTMIHAKNIELTPSLNEWIEEKMEALSRLFGDKDDLIEARIEVGRQSRHHQKGDVYYAEINLKMGANLMRAVVEHEDLRTAIDFARDDVERQVKKFKSKRRDLSRKPKE